MTAEPIPQPAEPILSVRDLVVEFETPAGRVRAVNDVELDVRQGQALGILGESGSGKSVTASAIMGLLDTPPAHVTSGEILLDEMNLVGLPEKQRQRVIGSEISMVFQDALTALNPVHTVGNQIGELYRVHRGMSRRASRLAAIEMMDRVRIPGAAGRVHDYPHQFSGGMRQRIVIAMALALDPKVLIADEPTTALDVTVQAQILELLKEQQDERDMGLVLITHDISVVSEVTDETAVMYAGRIVERGPTRDLLTNPAHPYSRGLASSVSSEDLKGKRLPAIPGQPPELNRLPAGCSFAPRCEFAQPECRISAPPLEEVAPGRRSACFFSDRILRQ
ncbi:ABC transporter ATP-binding protein [Spelaeicoccus albus]|uniref:Oligopeptide/dipeptide ABC transporter ATP-binding protein n=1 Tax=Spelaeicoccus albus TaxID=1280376 RepID=A0A7Z0D4V0_9MICO|nr:ABC transporter ATP-binding protein [Spelaeicoccus albus]NYI68875.1 oligopeptide/dipeptide ABC transporter ATP-binding protein [Spelaeicoccus albus]